ncbi:cytoskeletal protein RodZ [Trueperella bonasi]|uniref:Cytoskeletal protein RodZ n=1 Tax=Trueperella bonasi TaxID=312286 RepID=A0ABT9NGP4_9ACTO|nr:hypothetical protein [Trueperella bonasi]MDP9806355.1 cytoskeletal protein RodZ [Trueperella bonasi]
MSTSYARPGQRIADRFELVSPYAHPSCNAARAWIAHDVALSRHVRVVVIDPNADQVTDVIDAARRAALVTDPHLMAIVQVVSGEDHAYITEIPPGKSLAELLADEALPAEQIHAIIGETTSAIATGARRGVRHLQVRPDAIFITPEGEVVVDGLGVYSALVSADTSKSASELDRDEARGLTVLLASLLLGREFPDPAEHDAVIAQAAELELPAQLAATLASERDGDGAASPSDLTRRLVPWEEIAPREETAPSEESAPPAQNPPQGDTDEELASATELTDQAEPAEQPSGNSEPRATTHDEATSLIDEALGLDASKSPQVNYAWPGLSNAAASMASAAPAAKESERVSLPPERRALAERFHDAESETAPPSGFDPDATAPTAKVQVPQTATNDVQSHEEPEHRRPASLEAHSEREKKFDATRIVLVLFVIGVIVIGIMGLRKLTSPFDPVTLTDPDSDLNSSSTTDTPAETETQEDTPAPETTTPTTAPEIANASLVSPDAGMIAGIDPAQQDNPGSVGHAIDSDPSTAWNSWTYTSPTMSPMSGIGLHIELEEEAVITEVVLDVSGNGGNIQIRDTVPDAPSSGKIVAEGPVTAGGTTMTLDDPLTASSFVVWITELPQNVAGENQLVLNEITVN